MLKRIIKRLIWKIPVANYIMFESVPDLSDNTKAVFDEMVARGLNDKYRCIWWVSDRKKEYPRYKNVKYVDGNGLISSVLFYYYRVRAKCLICCNRFLVSSYTKGKKQSSFYLMHGTPIKNVGTYLIPSDINYVLTASEGTKSLIASAFDTEISKCTALGFPRNDAFTEPDIDLHEVFGSNFKKVIVWYPTFRQHKSGLLTNSRYALPLLHTPELAVRLNEMAREKEVLLVVKPHFAQDISYVNEYELSHIKFIDDDFFERQGISSYRFVKSCDALITDYSSIYFDYLLAGKPMAVIWEDIEDYKNKPGFALDVEYYMKAAEKIYTMEDFENFISEVSANEDRLKSERDEIDKWANYSRDGRNAARVTDFIMEKANLII